MSVTGTASEGAFLYDGYVIQLLCKESNWCDAVHNAVLALLLKEKLSKTTFRRNQVLLQHGSTCRCRNRRLAGLGDTSLFEFETGERRRWKRTILESYWFVERWPRSL